MVIVVAVASADLHSAVNFLWDTQGLDWKFKVNWEESLRTKFESLNDQEAPPSQPFPYCVFEQLPGTTITRMSGHDNVERHEIRDIPWSFRIHSRQVEGNDSTAKELAVDLAEFILMKFGGHPTVVPKQLTLDNGFVLIAQYQSDYGILSGDEEYTWLISYIFRIDTPVSA